MPFFLPSLKRHGHLDSVDLTVCNVGSRKHSFGDDYGSDRGWGIFAPNLTIIGFDADEAACAAANAEVEAQENNWNEFHFPYAIAQQSARSTLHVTKAPMCSSLYAPNDAFLRRFPRLPSLVTTDYMIEVDTISLDEFCLSEEIKIIDFLQIDVQGADLQVLNGAIQALDNGILAVQVEVEFSALYTDQPLFADIDLFMRAHGFSLFDLESISRETRCSDLFSTRRPGQILWADAIYLRDPLQLDDQSYFKQADQIFKLACVADVLEFTDYAFELLEYLVVQYGKDLKQYNYANSIVESLEQVDEFVKYGVENTPIALRMKDYLI
jgi:FkbM family methyltransferase